MSAAASSALIALASRVSYIPGVGLYQPEAELVHTHNGSGTGPERYYLALDRKGTFGRCR